jgi:5-aminopentanamidase
VLRVSVLELPARWADADEALDDVDALLSHPHAPTDLAILPEMSLAGYVSPEGEFDLSRFAEPITGSTVQRAAELARRHRAHLVVPLVLAEDDRLYNAAVVVGPRGDVVATYRKRHPWFPEQWATRGEQPSPLFEIGGLRVTIAICYDGHFLADDTADILARADLLIFMSAWVDEEDLDKSRRSRSLGVGGVSPLVEAEPQDSRMPLLRDLSRRFGISIANANWGPGTILVPGQGGSCILDGEARLLATVPTTLGAAGAARRALRRHRADAVVQVRKNTA